MRSRRSLPDHPSCRRSGDSAVAAVGSATPKRRPALVALTEGGSPSGAGSSSAREDRRAPSTATEPCASTTRPYYSSSPASPTPGASPAAPPRVGAGGAGSGAAYICRGAALRCDRFIRRLAIGFFFRFQSRHDEDGVGAGSCFVPFVAAPSSSSPYQLLSLGGLVDGGLLDSSRVVASRNGRAVLDLRRTRTGCILQLCVCNPMTGDVDFLAPLGGKDSPGPYACTLLTAADRLYLYDRLCTGSTTTSSSYRVLLVYNHRNYSALRCYSSDGGGGWGPEAKVIGARIGRRRKLGVKAHAALVRGGTVNWPGLSLEVDLRTLQTTAPPYTVQGSIAPPPQPPKTFVANEVDRLLGVMPDERLCVVESKGKTICAYVVSHADIVRNVSISGRKVRQWKLRPAQMAGGEHAVTLRWFCEMSGVVLFTARSGPNTYMYAVDVKTSQLGRVAGGEWPGDVDIDVCGYEMDRVAMLAELGR